MPAVTGEYASTYMSRLAESIYMVVSPDDELLEGYDSDLYLFYALLCVCKGTDVTTADVHNAWVAWRSQYDYDHSLLVPFGHLSPKERASYTRYRDAIHYIARNLDRLE